MMKKVGKLLLLFAYACGMQGQNFNEMVDNLIDRSVPLVQPNELEKELSEGKSILVIDAREEEEFQVSHIKNAVWLGYKDFDFSKLDASKDQDIVVYCSVGYRSEKIGERLQEAGYKNVRNLYGGLFKWNNEGYPIFNEESGKTEKIHAYSKSWGKWVEKGEKVYE